MTFLSDLPDTTDPQELKNAMEKDPVLYWNRAGLDMNRLSVSIGGPQGGPTMGSRALGILHLAIHDAYFAVVPPPAGGWSTYLAPPGAGEPTDVTLPAKPGGVTDGWNAIAGASAEVLSTLFDTRNKPKLGALLNTYLMSAPATIDVKSPSFKFGEEVAKKVLSHLSVLPGEQGADAGSYKPKDNRGKFRADPSNPTDPAHGPFYGTTARLFAVGKDHQIALPPDVGATEAGDDPEYIAALREVFKLGGAAKFASTTRNPDQTTAAYYWAYDGANLIGTPPRLYNQLIRGIAWARKTGNAAQDTAEFARLFALVNAAMGDAGIFAWQEKYEYELWRPLSAVREHDSSSGPLAMADSKVDAPADPFWEVLGAPSTNKELNPFKPPFPAYPSGHATFGAAAFQMVRRFYKVRGDANFGDREPDPFSFSFVSDELNGISRDLYQEFKENTLLVAQRGLVRTKVNRSFPSLWAAILENGASRVYLGVHFRFDAFAGEDVVRNTQADGSTIYKDASEVRYTTNKPGRDGTPKPVGGIPLGLEIADDIFSRGLRPAPASIQRPRPVLPAAGAAPGLEATPAATPARTRLEVKITDTNIR